MFSILEGVYEEIILFFFPFFSLNFVCFQNKKLVIPKEELDEYLYKRSFELSDGQLKYEITKHKRVSKYVFEISCTS